MFGLGKGNGATPRVISSHTARPAPTLKGVDDRETDLDPAAPGPEAPKVRRNRRSIEFDTGASKRKHDRVQRLQWTLILLQSFALVGLAYGFATLGPLRRDIPYFVTVNPEHSQLIEIIPFRDTPHIKTADSVDLFAKSMAMRYVKIRHEVVPDPAVMNKRWGTRCLGGGGPRAEDQDCAFIWTHSTQAVYSEFERRNKEAVGALIKDDIRRVVELTGEPRNVGENLLEIRFVMKDFQADRRTGKSVLLQSVEQSVYIWYQIRALQVEASQKYLNPFGFQVTRYERAQVQSRADPGTTGTASNGRGVEDHG